MFIKIVIVYLIIYNNIFFIYKQIYQIILCLDIFIDRNKKQIYIIKTLDINLYNKKYI